VRAATRAATWAAWASEATGTLTYTYKPNLAYTGYAAWPGAAVRGSGMVSRVRNESINNEDLIAALQKTARQAERAGQIIHRIRAFVRRSEPQRQKASAQTIVEDAVDLAGIELRRRNVAINTYVAQRLPPLLVDPILIEQVVLNLLKNAAEAIDNAHLPTPRRRIELRVVPRHTVDEGDVIEFTVSDKGPGLKDEVIARVELTVSEKWNAAPWRTESLKLLAIRDDPFRCDCRRPTLNRLIGHEEGPAIAGLATFDSVVPQTLQSRRKDVAVFGAEGAEVLRFHRHHQRAMNPQIFLRDLPQLSVTKVTALEDDGGPGADWHERDRQRCPAELRQPIAEIAVILIECGTDHLQTQPTASGPIRLQRLNGVRDGGIHHH